MKQLFLALYLLGSCYAALAQTPELDKGRVIFLNNCASCHGAEGLGNGPAAAAISGSKPRNFVSGKFKFGTSFPEVMKTVAKGSPGTLMPAWDKMLPEDERALVVRYVLSLRKKSGKP